MIGYTLFGVAMIRTATLPRWARVLVAVGALTHLLGFGIGELVTTAAWPIAIFGSLSLGVGLGWASSRLWHTPTTPEKKRRRRPTGSGPLPLRVDWPRPRLPPPREPTSAA